MGTLPSPFLLPSPLPSPLMTLFPSNTFIQRGMGLMPKDREQGTATVTGSRLFLFGGCDKVQLPIDDFSMLNTGTPPSLPHSPSD